MSLIDTPLVPAQLTRPVDAAEPAAPVAVTGTAVTRLATAALVDIVGGLAEAEDLWRPHVLHDPDDRARVRLLATPAYEVWLLGWTPGQSVGLHDHGGANGAFVVVDGALTETVAADPGDRANRVLVHHTIPAGGFGVVEAGHVHDVANPSTRLATSIHAYSKPLRSMGFYEMPAPDRRGHRVRTLWIDEVEAVLRHR